MAVRGIMMDDRGHVGERREGRVRDQDEGYRRREDIGKGRDRDETRNEAGRGKDRDDGGRARDRDEGGRRREDVGKSYGSRGKDREDGGRWRDRDDEARGREDPGKGRDQEEARSDGGKGKGKHSRDGSGAPRRREFVQDPGESGLQHYLSSQESPPDVPEEKRYNVRDEVAKQVLRHVGCTDVDLRNFTTYEDFANTKLVEFQRSGEHMKSKLSTVVQAQFKHVTLFQGAPHQEKKGPFAGQLQVPQTGPPGVGGGGGGDSDADAENPVNPLPEDAYRPEMNLLGQFDCVAVPACADFDAFFDAVDLDCNAHVLDSFVGWFWCVHAAAPNIGEDSNAEDFPNYSLQVPIPTLDPASDGDNQPNRIPILERQNSRQVLDEKAYLEDFRRIWQSIILSMGVLEVDDAILFPIGMGAFLRQLGVNDSNYCDKQAMKMLRRRIADRLMDVVCSLYPGIDKTSVEQRKEDQLLYDRAVREWEAHQRLVDASDRDAENAEDKAKRVKKPKAKPKPTPKPPKQIKNPLKLPHRIHICLIVANTESIENHNAFVEAAADKVREYPGLKDILLFHRNADVMDLARTLSVDKSPLKIALLNGANRKLFGNHWFQPGAKFAMDENLHRRSTSLSRVSLLLNMSTEPTDRRRDELANHILSLGGKTVVLAAETSPTRVAVKENRGVLSSLFSCFGSGGTSGGRSQPDRGRPQAVTSPRNNPRGAPSKPPKSDAKAR